MKPIMIMIIAFTIVMTFAISDAIPVSANNDETSTTSTSTTTIQNDNKKEAPSEDSVEATTLPPETADVDNNNNFVYIAEIYTNPGVFLLVAEQRRFRFPYRRRFFRKQQKEYDDGFPALF